MPTKLTYVFDSILRKNRDYFPRIYEHIMLFNCNKLYFLCDKKWILNNINRIYLKFILILSVPLLLGLASSLFTSGYQTQTYLLFRSQMCDLFHKKGKKLDPIAQKVFSE